MLTIDNTQAVSRSGILPDKTLPDKTPRSQEWPRSCRNPTEFCGHSSQPFAKTRRVRF